MVPRNINTTAARTGLEDHISSSIITGTTSTIYCRKTSKIKKNCTQRSFRFRRCRPEWCIDRSVGLLIAAGSLEGFHRAIQPVIYLCTTRHREMAAIVFLSTYSSRFLPDGEGATY